MVAAFQPLKPYNSTFTGSEAPDLQAVVYLTLKKISVSYTTDICFLHVSQNGMFRFMLCIPLCR